MTSRIIEATQGFNHGKFMLCRFDAREWSHPSALEGGSLLRRRGWTEESLWVLDLQTGEGACFAPGGMPSADLNKHAIWVCPLYEPFLAWLYRQDLRELDALPALVTLSPSEAPAAMCGYRRPGPSADAAASSGA